MKVVAVLVVKTSLLFASDWGWWGVEASVRGIVQVVLPQRSPHQVRKQLGNEENSASLVAEEAAGQIQEYLYGRRQHFNVPVDWEPFSGFVRQILQACAQIAYGETISYGELARRGEGLQHRLEPRRLRRLQQAAVPKRAQDWRKERDHDLDR